MFNCSKDNESLEEPESESFSSQTVDTHSAKYREDAQYLHIERTRECQSLHRYLPPQSLSPPCETDHQLTIKKSWIMSFCGGSWQTLDSGFLGSIHAHYLLAI